MLKGATKLWKKAQTITGYRYSLQQLQDTLNKTNKRDSKSIMKFVMNMDKFDADDRATAVAVIQSSFWSQGYVYNNHGEIIYREYHFSRRFKSLSVEDLCILIDKMGNKHIKEYIFEHKNKQILLHYSQTDLFKLLRTYYSDTFAIFVFQAFDNYLKCPLSERKQYLNIVSIDAMVTVYQHGNIGKRLHIEELLIYFERMKQYMISDPDTNYYKYQAILSSVSKQIIQQNVGLLNVKGLSFIFVNHLAPGFKAKIIKEIMERRSRIQNDLKFKERLIGQYQNDLTQSIAGMKVVVNNDDYATISGQTEVQNANTSLVNHWRDYIAFKQTENDLTVMIQHMLMREYEGDEKKMEKMENDTNQLMQRMDNLTAKNMELLQINESLKANLIKQAEDHDNKYKALQQELQQITSVHGRNIEEKDRKIEKLCIQIEALMQQKIDSLPNDEEKKNDDDGNDGDGDYDDNICKLKFKNWLFNTVKLKQYLSNFERNECDNIAMIEFLDDDAIKNDIGIHNKLHRKLIIKQVNKFKILQSEFNNMLDNNEMLKEYKEIFEANGILILHDLHNDVKTKEELGRMLKIMDENKLNALWAAINQNDDEFANNEGQSTENH